MAPKTIIRHQELKQGCQSSSSAKSNIPATIRAFFFIVLNIFILADISGHLCDVLYIRAIS